MSNMPVPSSADLASDDLAVVVVRRLERRSPVRSWGLLQTILLGVPSFGLIPMLVWPARFRDYAADETQALQELAQWAKLRGRQPAAVGPLLAAAEDTAVSPFPFVLSLLFSALVVGVFAIRFAHISFSLDNLLDSTYRGDSHFAGSSPLSPHQFVYRVWVAALSVGYAVQWVNIRTHAANVKRFVERFDPISKAEGLPSIRLPVRGWAYFRPIWILAAVILSLYGAYWGIAMILGGMAQRRYVQVTSRIVRQELVKRVKDMVMLRQSPMLLVPVMTSWRCGNPRCLAALRAQSRFCTRCGSNSPEAGNS